jgi:hypothetical protein
MTRQLNEAWARAVEALRRQNYWGGWAVDMSVEPPKEVREGIADRAAQMIFPATMALSFMHCKNVSLETVRVIAVATSLLLIQEAAQATMPLLTKSPDPPTPTACQKWAAEQDDDAIDMWGIQEDGTSSRAVALRRLYLVCLGHEQTTHSIVDAVSHTPKP